MKSVGLKIIFQPLRMFNYLAFIFFFCKVSEGVNVVKLTSDFVQLQGGYAETCNFVLCNESDKIKISKEISSTFTCFATISSIANFSNNLNTKRRNLFIVQNTCSSSSEFLTKVNSQGFFKSKHIWLLFQPLKTRQSINNTNSYLNRDDFRNFELTIASEFYLAQETFSERIQLIGFYKRDPDNSLVKEYLNEWSFDKGFDNRVFDSFAIRRQNLYGRVFSSAIVLADPKSLEYSDSLLDIHIDSLSRVDHAMVLLVMKSLNASTDFIITTTWGNKVNGTYDGMIGLVVDGKAEIAATQSFPTKERLEVIEYIDKPIRTQGRYIFMSPPLSYKRNIFILPFDEYVWFTYIGLVLTTIPLLYYASRLESRTRRSKDDRNSYGKNKYRNYSLEDILMLNVAAFCTQGSHTLESTAASGRLTIVTLFVMVIFISVSYNAYIMVLLRTTDKSIVTLKDLLKSNLELGVYNTTYNKYYYSTAEEPIRKAIAKKIFSYKKRDPFVSIEEGVQRIRTDRYAFDVEYSPGYHMVKAIFTEEEKCRLQAIKQSFVPDIEPMLSIRKDLSYTEILKIKFERLHERGLAHRIGVRLYTKKPTCTASTSFHFSIGLTDTHHVFQLLAFALLTSWIILILELLTHRRNSKKISKPPSLPFSI